MHAVRSNSCSQRSIAREEKKNPARTANRPIAPGGRFAARVVVIAINDGGARRHRAQHGFGIRDAAAVGHEGEGEGRLRA